MCWPTTHLIQASCSLRNRCISAVNTNHSDYTRRMDYNSVQKRYQCLSRVLMITLEVEVMWKCVVKGELTNGQDATHGGGWWWCVDRRNGGRRVRQVTQSQGVICQHTQLYLHILHNVQVKRPHRVSSQRFDVTQRLQRWCNTNIRNHFNKYIPYNCSQVFQPLWIISQLACVGISYLSSESSI